VSRFHLLGSTGYVSDDTEQAALVAQCVARHSGDALECARAFRRSLLGWFLRLRWGVGLATVRACFRILLGLRPSGVRSAGNGAVGDPRLGAALDRAADLAGLHAGTREAAEALGTSGYVVHSVPTPGWPRSGVTSSCIP
jgi:ADP-ribosylglycohydrolase